jgi:16S rRNA (uracil1498-N3)-methyltransferase
VSRAPWIHVERLPGPGETVALDFDEARHAGRAHRLTSGAEIVLTDGRGMTARAELVEGGRREARARILELTHHEAETPSIHLASALPKGDRLATLLSMATQLGIASFTPLMCARSVVTPSDETPARWERILRESAKQSHRAHLPRIGSPRTPHSLIDSTDGPTVWLMDPDAESGLSGAVSRPDGHLVVVGPEGGFSEDESRTLQRAGARPARLGTGVLRVETACVAAVAALRAAATV